MSIWIKICGNTSVTDAMLAVDAGADAVGFVFASGPRQVTLGEAAAICRHLPAAIEKIGVFVDSPLEDIYEAVRTAGLTGVQLHFNAAPSLPAKLHQRLGNSQRILRVIHFQAASDDSLSAQLVQLAADEHVHAVLVDSRTANAVGGTGIRFDWVAARQTIFAPAQSVKLIVAGGLHPGNVAEAIATLRPWGVDVVSGVEAAPGRKDPSKVKAFVERARAEANSAT